ncbi:MAG: hypothetical protein ACRDRO_30180 [Pseudonocardiaceae bacterium]
MGPQETYGQVGQDGHIIECRAMLCVVCDRLEYFTYRDGEFIRREYFDSTPVMHH